MKKAMRSVRWFPGLIFAITAVVYASAAVAASSTASYAVWEIALTPGADDGQMNIAWHTTDDAPVCAVQVADTAKRGRQFHDVIYGRHFGAETTPQQDNYNEVTIVGLQTAWGLTSSSWGTSTCLAGLTKCWAMHLN